MCHAEKIVAVCPHDKVMATHRVVNEADGIAAYCDGCGRRWTAKNIVIGMYLNKRQALVTKSLDAFIARQDFDGSL